MVVPLVVHAEGLDTVADWVLRKVLEFRFPMGIDGPVRFEIPANPFQEMITRLPFRNLNSVMDANNSHTPIRELVQLIEVLIDWVASAAIAVHNHHIRIFKRVWIFGPPILKDDGFVFWERLFDCGGQEFATREVFVRPIAVARPTRHEGNFFPCSKRITVWQQDA